MAHKNHNTSKYMLSINIEGHEWSCYWVVKWKRNGERWRTQTRSVSTVESIAVVAFVAFARTIDRTFLAVLRTRCKAHNGSKSSDVQAVTMLCFIARAATSGECLRGEGLVWLIGAVVCVVAAALRSCTIGTCQSTATSCGCTAPLVAALPV